MAQLIGTARDTPDYPTALATATRTGWRVVSEGASGAQLFRPKQWSLFGKIGTVAAVLTFALDWRLSLFLAVVAALEFVFLSPSKSVFLSREKPHRVQ